MQRRRGGTQIWLPISSTAMGPMSRWCPDTWSESPSSWASSRMPRLHIDAHKHALECVHANRPDPPKFVGEFPHALHGMLICRRSRPREVISGVPWRRMRSCVIYYTSRTVITAISSWTEQVLFFLLQSKDLDKYPPPRESWTQRAVFLSFPFFLFSQGTASTGNVCLVLGFSFSVFYFSFFFIFLSPRTLASTSTLASYFHAFPDFFSFFS